MRSLTPLGVHISSLEQFGSSSQAGNIAINPEDGTVYVTVERSSDDGGIEIDILQISTDNSEPEVIASFTSPVLAPFPKPAHRGETLDLHFLPDDRSLVILLAGGDIATLALEGEDGGVAPVEVVGSVDSGIKAAAWAPDDEQIVLMTGEDNLVCMTRHFDVIHEEPLRSDDFGEDKFINVGWGSRQTQFHGSLGKAAAKQPINSSQSLSHPTDSGLPYITFRGDASYFAISSLDPYSDGESARRQIRIYSRDSNTGFVPKLSATSENLPGLEGNLSWRPTGNLISTLIRYGYPGGGEGREGKWDIAMLERNGLRHGGFELREDKQTWKDGKVKGLQWNSDSEVLAIWIERSDKDVVQLWSMKNYHYYLKQELFSHDSTSPRFKGFKWHPEDPLSIYLYGEDFVQARAFVWDTYTARLPMPHDTASVAVVDGQKLLITPFRTQNTPPPMSSYHLDLPSVPIHVSLSDTTDSLAVLFSDGLVQVWDLNTRLPDPKSGSRLRGGGKVAEPKLRYSTNLRAEGKRLVKQLAFGPNGKVAVLSWAEKEGSIGCQVNVVDEKEETEVENLEGDIERLLWTGEGELLVLTAEGQLTSGKSSFIIHILSCSHVDIVCVVASDHPVDVTLGPHPTALSYSASSDLIFALSPNSKLHLAALSPSSPISTPIASNVNSYTLTPDFLIYTTTSQTSHYAPLPTLKRLAHGDDLFPHEMVWDERRVERGSLIVTACESSMSLVLQMPRGNLETVYPRALVLAVVKQDVLSGNYRNAFLQCRKHRLDLNVLYDLDPAQFMKYLKDFVEQVPEVDYLNLFVSSLNSADSARVLYGDHSKDPSSSSSKLIDKVNSLCDSLRSILEQRGVEQYVETILTTHVCKQPADYESGLKVLLTLQADHPEIVEDAIKYIIFLSDVNRLYDVALGMYNFQLVLMIAQYSQKDPKEYLPFLRELRALDKWDQRFMIDDHLARRESALRNLKQCGPERFEEASSYLSRYELYDEAFVLYADEPEHLQVIHDLYGDYLYDRRDFTDAAISYILAKKEEKALKAYEKAHAWRELFTLAKKLGVSKDDTIQICERVTDHLSSRGRHLEASQVFIEHASDVDSAVDVLCRGTEFSEAYRLTSLHDRSDLIESMIHPGLEEAHEALMETFEEMEGQLDKEVNRLKDLRRIRENDPESFFIVDTEPAIEGVDVATNATTAVTGFTRYTVAPTTVFSQTTKMTGQTAKSKKSRKRATGRKGTVDEYEYLVASIGRLVVRVDDKSNEATSLLRHLRLATSDHIELSKSLQTTIIAFREKLNQSIEFAWEGREDILKEVVESGGAGLEEGLDKSLALVRPVVGGWKGLGILVGQ
ncbi:elongator complex protein 1 [Kwoniella mangroviensis CBS 8886]|nr:elongator complex protein 1 [Kwoniella mangroviensis CBS 8507]OCF69133.1 elongator complex protein 1 [Kwoniella mangroviensis CBS 8507]OCF72658.1 elongator complex protein 1 [Kwoniella mangroviensis CBS 8886]